MCDVIARAPAELAGTLYTCPVLRNQTPLYLEAELKVSCAMDTFSCRLFHADFYLSAPLPLLDTAYSYFRGEAVSLVPVIRIFGAAPNGQKACVHIHGVFPYLLVPASCQKVTDSLLHRLAISIDYALQVSLGGGSRRGQHVFKIIPVEAK